MNTARQDQSPSFAGDLQFIFGVLWSKAWLIVLCAGAAVALAFLYLRSTPKVYAAKAVIQIEQEEQRVLKIEGLRSEDLKSLEVLKTYEQSITSPEVLLRVIHHPSLVNDPGFLPEVKQRSDNLLEEALSKRIEAKIRRGTRLIDIKVEDQNPALARRVAALLIDEFDRWNLESRREAGQSARQFLLEETDRLKAQLTKSEQALQNYKEQNEAVSLEDKQNITVDKLKDINLRVTVAKAERLKLESDAAQMKEMDMRAAGQLLALPSIASAPSVVELRKSLGESEARLAMLSQRYLPEHPKYIQARSELENITAALDAAIRKAADVLTSQHEAALLTEQKLEAALREQQKLALELDKLSMSYAVLVRDAESDRELYNSVLTRLKETDVTKNMAQDSVRAIARPLLPDRPVKPRKSLALALSVMAGLAAGCGLAFALHAANRSLRTLEDAEARLGLPSLSEIPKLPPPKRRSKRSPLEIESDPAAAESFRTLRTSLLLIGHDAAPKTFLFTSAHPAEGKTFCAINCAVSFAQLGLKTLLVDADLRRPRIDKVFVESSPVRRTGEPTRSEAAWHEALQETEIPNLSLLPAEKIGPEAAASFSEPGFAQFLQRATAEFDRVVLDSAPVHLVSDTLLIAKHVEAVCLVIHAGKTSAQDALRAAKRLTQAGAPLVGFVWNRTKARHGYYYERAAAAGGRGAKHGRGPLLGLEPHLRIGISTNGHDSDSSPPGRSS